jgi:carboxypeptidase C (cathepsin A)
MPIPITRRAAAALALVLLAATPLAAQQPNPHEQAQAASESRPRGGGQGDGEQGGREQGGRDQALRLPEASVTQHKLDLTGRTLEFTATLGAVPLYDGEGGPLIAEVVTTAFTRPSEDGKPRPVTFLVNGGPGAASAYLDIGAIGPWRLPLSRIAPSSPAVTVPNDETWLDFTDLVFIDPVGTGYSWGGGRGEDSRRRFWSVDGDIQSLATVIRKWIERNDRQGSPKFIVGESYGGFRGPKIVRQLQAGQGVGVAGLILVSPVLDFGWRFQDRHSPMRWVSELPSMAAAARDTTPSGSDVIEPGSLKDVEDYAAGEFMTDLLRGVNDDAATQRMAARVSGFTGLDLALVRRLSGRVDAGTFVRERGREAREVGSLYDATVLGPDPNPSAAVSRPEDPVLDGSEAPLSSAMTDLYRRLGWRIDRPYKLLSEEVGGAWQWGSRRTAPEAVGDLREALALDQALHVLVVHGGFDLVTPYFENRLILNQLPAFDGRLKLSVYRGGHMFYMRDAARAAFRADAQKLYGDALGAVSRLGSAP